MRVDKWKSFLLQNLRAWQSLFSLAERSVAMSMETQGISQYSLTTWRKPGCSTQKFSNLKIPDFGILVWIDTTQGIWSEIYRDRGLTIVLGQAVVQLFVVKNQSNCSKRGLPYMLLQVKFLPLIGSSTNPRVLMIALKTKISCIFSPGLFLLPNDLSNDQ